MIISLIIIGIAFLWLMIETDYLTLRMLAYSYCQEGDRCHWHLPDECVTAEMKQELLNSWTNLPKEIKWKFAAGIQDPMCGWGYAYQYRDYQPEYKVEMNLANVRYKMTVKDQSILKDIMKANKLTKSQKLELWAKA